MLQERNILQLRCAVALSQDIRTARRRLHPLLTAGISALTRLWQRLFPDRIWTQVIIGRA
jgi:hypothetical protein